VLSFELECRNCGWRTVSGRDDAIARLRLIGLLRRETDPDDDLVATLLVAAAPRMTCPLCKDKRLIARPFADDDDGDWLAPVLCEVCRTPIAAERLAAVPDAKRCAACQGKAETGQLQEIERDFCPNCGAIIEIRLSRGSGITRFKRVCTGDPPCRL
jgi:Zn finger protein HypA/HybF involved in hydrogenase expression